MSPEKTRESNVRMIRYPYRDDRHPPATSLNLSRNVPFWRKGGKTGFCQRTSRKELRLALLQIREHLLDLRVVQGLVAALRMLLRHDAAGGVAPDRQLRLLQRGRIVAHLKARAKDVAQGVDLQADAV